MDYEKKYKDAQKWIESIYSELSHEQQMEAEAFFPELKESEDERIRKEIIATIHLYYGEPLEDEAKEMIAWLEKQGEYKSPEEVLKIRQELYQSGYNDGYKHGCEDSKKQGEQKLADKVEPKFHEGEWVVTSYGKVNQVVAVDKDGDGFTLDDDTYFSGSWKDGYHLWTIKDAKDGDVLVAPPIKGQEGKEQIFIFKGINNRNYVDNCIEYYCRVYEGVFYENENDCGYMGTTSSPIYPATKSQRDTLFTKMKEAGYEWNSEKRELKKNSQRMISAEAKEAMYDKPTNNDMKEALRTEYEKGRADVLRCIDPDEMVADFCSQPLSKTRSIASVYRQGIIDILKRINSNEENSITGTYSIDNCGL